MRINFKALAVAIVIELGLGVLALFGGPHGVLGGWPWLLQFPGALVMLVSPSDSEFPWQVVVMLAIQIALWYTICMLVRRWYAGRRASAT